MATIDKLLVCGILFFMPDIKIGDKIGKLTVIDIKKEWKINKNGYKSIKPTNIISCKCDCGNIICLEKQHLYSKRNCGCKYGNTKYKNYNKKLYTAWRTMKTRCFWDKCPNYNNYGGRGITVCEGLLDFNNYQKILGEPPTKEHSVDRINNNLSYSCGECQDCNKKDWKKNIRWATLKMQANNKRNNILIELNGEIMSLKAACAINGLPYKQIHERIKRGGWDKNIAINTPINKNNRYKGKRNERQKIKEIESSCGNA